MVRNDDVDYISIGQRVKAVRMEQGLSQEALAARADIPVRVINNVENAKSKTSLESFVKIADALSLRIDDLLCNSPCASSLDLKKQMVELLSDCSEYERRIIIDTALATKSAIRQQETVEKETVEKIV